MSKSWQDEANDSAWEDYCEIRHFKIEDPYWTYCANHPHRNADKIELPIGPIYVFDQFEDEYARNCRRVLQPSPDTEEIRVTLLRLLESVNEEPRPEYPAGFYLDEVVVWQLGEFRESRAVTGLKRILRFDPAKSVTFPPWLGFVGTPNYPTRQRLLQLAREALGKING